MVSNEIFVGAGTSATFVPEMDMFYNDGTVDANTLNKVTITINRNGISVIALGNILGIGIIEIISSIVLIKIIASK